MSTLNEEESRVLQVMVVFDLGDLNLWSVQILFAIIMILVLSGVPDRICSSHYLFRKLAALYFEHSCL